MTSELDLRGEVCPYTFVKARLKLEDMEHGEEITILLDDSAATANVSKSLKNEGHEILRLNKTSDGVWKIIIKKT